MQNMKFLFYSILQNWFFNRREEKKSLLFRRLFLIGFLPSQE